MLTLKAAFANSAPTAAIPAVAARKRRTEIGGSVNRGLAVTFCALLAAQPVLAAEAGILAKVGGTYETRSRDRARCHSIVAGARADDLRGMEPVPMASGGGAGLAGVAGAAIANLLILGIETDRARARTEGFCLSNLGYAIVL